MDKKLISSWESNLKKSVWQSIEEGFIDIKSPPRPEYLSFNSMKEYREWCDKNLPSYLGYGRKL
jgi:hypothetical protein